MEKSAPPNFMIMQLSNLELHSLKSMYERKVAELTHHLNNGKPWEEMKELRDSLSELSALIYDKVQSSDCDPVK